MVAVETTARSALDSGAGAIESGAGAGAGEVVFAASAGFVLDGLPPSHQELIFTVCVSVSSPRVSLTSL